MPGYRVRLLQSRTRPVTIHLLPSIPINGEAGNKNKKGIPLSENAFLYQLAKRLGFAAADRQHQTTDAQEGQGGGFGNNLQVQHVAQTEGWGSVGAINVIRVR